MPLSLSRSIRYWRSLNQWNLRDFAARCGFSHTHAAALERGTLPSDRHLKQIETVLGVTLKVDEVLKLQLENFESQLTQMILFHQREQAEVAERKLKALADLYYASAYAFDYYFIVSMLHVLISAKPWFPTHIDMKLFNVIEPLFKREQIVLFRLTQAAYETIENRHANALNLLLKALENDDLGLFNGVYHQYIANIYNDTFYKKLSLKHYHQARLLFEQTHNYYRLRAAHLRSRILDLVDRIDPDENEIKAIKKEALTYNFKGIDLSVSMMLAQASVRHHRYETVIEILEPYASTSQKASFILAAAYYFMGEHTQVKKVFSQYQRWQIHPLFRLGFEALLNPEDEPMLKAFYQRTIEGLNAFENSISYRLLNDY